MCSSLEFKKTIIFVCLLVILAPMVSASFSGATRKIMGEPSVQAEVFAKEARREIFHKAKAKAKASFHPRILKVKTNDYGRYDPAPALQKPAFKLIPN